MAPLLVLLARQASLESLTMIWNDLSGAQIAQIQEVVTSSAPNCQIKVMY